MKLSRNLCIYSDQTQALRYERFLIHKCFQL
jgi:hypothetical protein